MNLIVDRIHDDGTQTISLVKIVDCGKDLYVCAGLELPYKNNEHNISCIPAGIYKCEKVAPSPSIPYEHFLVLNVPDRLGICIHRANFVSQLRGCLAVGEKHVDINNDNELDVTNSKRTLEDLLHILPEEFEVEFKNDFINLT